MDIQHIIAYIAVVIAFVFLIKKFFFASKSKSKCDDEQCGCG